MTVGWDRQLPETVAAPAAISAARWVGAAVVAALAGVSLFMLYASQAWPPLQVVSPWVLAVSPLLLVTLAFAVRMYGYGGALDHHRFLEQEAQAAQHSWEAWSRRHMRVHDSCVLLPEQVSAAVLASSAVGLPPCAGAARRLSVLPQEHADRIQTALLMVLKALAPSLKALSLGPALRVTLLSDARPEHHELVASAWRRAWNHATDKAEQPTLIQVTALTYGWVEERIKSASQVVELIVVVQVNGAQRYSDALAGLLLACDCSTAATALPVKGLLLRPMPLDIGDVPGEVAQLMQSQRGARQATGLLADAVHWKARSGEIIAENLARDGALKVGECWVQETLCGLPGPFSSWLVVALGAELAQHRGEPLLVLGTEPSQHWMSTIDTGENV